MSLQQPPVNSVIEHDSLKHLAITRVAEELQRACRGLTFATQLDKGRAAIKVGNADNSFSIMSLYTPATGANGLIFSEKNYKMFVGSRAEEVQKVTIIPLKDGKASHEVNATPISHSRLKDHVFATHQIEIAPNITQFVGEDKVLPALSHVTERFHNDPSFTQAASCMQTAITNARHIGMGDAERVSPADAMQEILRALNAATEKDTAEKKPAAIRK